jgi:hypothetical protein
MQTTHTAHINQQKEVKIYKNSPYCVTNAVEIWWKILQNGSQNAHNIEIITLILTFFTFLKISVLFS